MRTAIARRSACVALAMLVLLSATACGDEDDEPPWQVVGRDMPAALLSVGGTSATDVYLVGADARDGEGPMVLHFDGSAWTRLMTGHVGDLWWVFAAPGGAIYMGGDGGTILRYQSGAFTRMPTPGTHTVFGIWGATDDDLWAVGGASGGAGGGFAWRLQGDTWVDAGLPADVAANQVMWKIYGRSADDAWMIGTNGKTVRWDGAALTTVDTGTGESLFTVHADAQRFVAVGGFGTASILENTGDGWRDASPPGAPAMIGVTTDGGGYAVGSEGAVYRRGSAGWGPVDLGVTVEEAFHSVWVDSAGGVWAVGGQVQTFPLIDGIVLHRGAMIPALP